MLDDDQDPTTTDDAAQAGGGTAAEPAPAARTRRRAVSRPAGPPAGTDESGDEPAGDPPATAAPAKKAARKTAAKTAGKTAAKKAAKKTAAKKAAKKAVRKTAKTAAAEPAAEPAAETVESPAETPAAPAVTTTTTTRRRASRPAAAPAVADLFSAAQPSAEPSTEPSATQDEDEDEDATPGAEAGAAPVFQAPETTTPRRRSRKRAEPAPAADEAATAASEASPEPTQDAGQDPSDHDGDDGDDGTPSRRRRRRGGRRRRKGSADASGDDAATDADGSDQAKTDQATSDDVKADADDEDGEGSSRRRRRRRRRGGSGGDEESRSAEDEITSVSGSTRLEAKKQRRREGREAGRRRAPIVSEAEFLARREAVARQMVIRQREDLTQIAVMEDDVLVEHYVARESQSSLIGNVYLGRVQNVLPSMEAAFVDIGKGRNAVLYAGEVDWKTLGDGKQRRIEEVLKSGQHVLVQVTKDPIGHKGARLTSQISLAGRFLVYVPRNHTSGISRKLPDVERTRLKGLLKDVLPEDAGVIIRTAAEGATEDQLTRDVSALTARWEDIERKAAAGGKAPQLLYGEPDLMIKVVRDLFNEDFESLVVEGDDAWDMVQGYVQHVAPDLAERLSRWDAQGSGADSFAAHRIDEQIAKGLDRKVWLPSGGSLIIDRTEAMTVVDVNTGKFTGSGGNLEETVTKNNLEAAEEIVRQLRLRDIGGIIVIDFIDMVLENNRDLVLRRLVECLGRDRTRHQVAEVTSLGLVQMTRKRIGTGLLEAFSEPCEHCQGRGLVTHETPVEPKQRDEQRRGGGGGGGGRRRGGRGGRDDAKDAKDAKDTKADDTTAADVGTGTARSGGDEPAEAAPARRAGGRRGSKRSAGAPDQAGEQAPEQPAEPVLTGDASAP